MKVYLSMIWFSLCNEILWIATIFCAPVLTLNLAAHDPFSPSFFRSVCAAIALVLCFVCHNLRCALFGLVGNSFIIQHSDSTTCLCYYCVCFFFFHFDVLRPFHCWLHHQLHWEYLYIVEHNLMLANESSDIMHPVSTLQVLHCTYTAINSTIYISFNYSLDFAFVVRCSLAQTIARQFNRFYGKSSKIKFRRVPSQSLGYEVLQFECSNNLQRPLFFARTWLA